MKILEQIALTIFSVLILVLSLTLCLILFNWIDTSNVYLWILLTLVSGIAAFCFKKKATM